MVEAVLQASSVVRERPRLAPSLATLDGSDRLFPARQVAFVSCAMIAVSIAALLFA